MAGMEIELVSYTNEAKTGLTIDDTALSPWRKQGAPKGPVVIPTDWTSQLSGASVVKRLSTRIRKQRQGVPALS